MHILKLLGHMNGSESIITINTSFAQKEIVLMNNIHQFFVHRSIYKVPLNISKIVFPTNNCFRTLAHKAQTHSKELGKQGHKEARTLKLEFNLRPRHFPAVEAGRPNQYQPPRQPPRQPTSDS